MEELLESLRDKQEQARELRDRLDKSLAIRRLWGLPSDGVVKIKKVKPSGVLPSEVSKFRVDIYHDDVLVSTTTAKEFKETLDNEGF